MTEASGDSYDLVIIRGDRFAAYYAGFRGSRWRWSTRCPSPAAR